MFNFEDKHDPGWNDPPTFSYNPEAVAAKPKNVLNKRVPYSMNSNPAPVQDTNMPLSAPPIGSLLPSTSDLRQNIIAQNMDCDTKVYDFEETINIFKELIYTSPELGKKASDIQKRLQIMETMWREGKLNLDVQNKTSQMAKGILFVISLILCCFSTRFFLQL